MTTSGGAGPTQDFKLEVIVIPVADLDRAKEFSAGLGWRLDADFAFDNGVPSSSSHHPARMPRSSSAPT